MHTRIITKPQYHPVSLAEVKAQCRVLHSHEDALLSGVILPAAHGEAVHQLQRAIMLTTYQGSLDDLPCGRLMPLPWPQLQSVTSIYYNDAASAQQLLSSAIYGVDMERSRVFLKPNQTWPLTDCGPSNVLVRYTAGYATGDEAAQQAAVPESVKQWILIRCSTLYEHREAIIAGTIVSEIPFVNGLLDTEREWGV